MNPAVTIYLITEFLESFFIATHGNRLSAIGSNTIICFYVFISLSLRQSAVETRKSEATFELGMNSYYSGNSLASSVPAAPHLPLGEGIWVRNPDTQLFFFFRHHLSLSIAVCRKLAANH